MLAAFTSLQKAQKVKRFISVNNLSHTDFLPIKELDHIYFPLRFNVKIPNASVVDTKFSFPKKERPKTIDEVLRNKLTQKQLQILPRTQEIVGKIMVLEIPEALRKKEILIAQAYLQTNQNIETVVKKQQIHSGTYRLRKVKVLAGKKSKETVHFENGVKIKLHLEQTYFSARSGNERLRIAKQVKEGENVLVMFSGAGPYPLVLARNSPARHIYGVELNLLAHQYAVRNIALNNLNSKITLYRSDVRRSLPKMNRKFDRIVMPLPKTGEEFLTVALPKAKKGAIVHLYSFLREKQITSYKKHIKHLCGKLGYKVKVLRSVKCGQFAPGTFRICFDILRQ